MPSDGLKVPNRMEKTDFQDTKKPIRASQKDPRTKDRAVASWDRRKMRPKARRKKTRKRRNRQPPSSRIRVDQCRAHRLLAPRGASFGRAMDEYSFTTRRPGHRFGNDQKILSDVPMWTKRLHRRRIRCRHHRQPTRPHRPKIINRRSRLRRNRLQKMLVPNWHRNDQSPNRAVKMRTCPTKN